jgi:AMP phosphorylase
MEGEQMIFKAKLFNINAGKPVIILHKEDALKYEMMASDRVVVKHGRKKAVAFVDTTDNMVKPGEVGLFGDVYKRGKFDAGEVVELFYLRKPKSLQYIRRKLDSIELLPDEIDEIIRDVMSGTLSDPELAVFISAVYTRGFNINESVALTKSIVNSGETIDLGKNKKIVDKHSIGGVTGRTTMVITPILAACGAYVPKTSSRAITSAGGTADAMEILCDVNFTAQEIKDIVLKTKGCVVWGGGAQLAPADDKLIKIRHPFSLDPRGMLLASIMAKKKSVGAQYVVIDLPVGRGAKIKDKHEATELAHDFKNISEKIGINTNVVLTDGTDPVGWGVGPSLETIDVIRVLQGDGPRDLIDKSCTLSGIVLEMCGLAKPGTGYKLSMDTIKNGKAFKKFEEIVHAQGGAKKLKVDDLPVGKHKTEIYCPLDGRVDYVSNRRIAAIARAAGAPKMQGSGVILKCENGDRVKKGQVLFEIYSDSETQLTYALKVAEELHPIELKKVLLETI